MFRSLSAKDYLNGCSFRLTGVVTLLDTNRNLLVIQDESGDICLNHDLQGQVLQVGQMVRLDGDNCHPYFVSFPDYPFRPSGRELRTTFEAPSERGEYYLARMRGYLHPPVTGEYTFWIASDNSSELWLSTDDDPSNARRIASIARYAWVDRREWDRFPSQRSTKVELKAGQTCYIEALHEQTTGTDHLAVAWEGPGLRRSVIGGRYITPWTGHPDGGSLTATNGLLREYWTNYSAGSLSMLTEPKPFESALSVENLQVRVLGDGLLPKAERIILNEQLHPEDNFRWVEVEGRVTFSGIDGDTALIELTDGQAQIQVRALHWNPELPCPADDTLVRVEGVCEGVYDQRGVWVPGLIWASIENCISVIDTESTNASPTLPTSLSSTITMANTNLAMAGFYGIRGVVTFNDQVFGKDLLYVQQDATAIFVSLENRHYAKHLKVGQFVDLGGSLRPGKYIPTINPLVITELGWRALPRPRTPTLISGDNDGRWTELEGIVRVLNPDGTIALLSRAGRISLWLGQTPSNEFGRYVDSKLRVRGVLSLTASDAPVLLVPSRNYVEVVKQAPEQPFSIPVRNIEDIASEAVESASGHKVRLSGEVTYRDARSFYLQDSTGGIRVQTTGVPDVQVGESVEVVGFPSANGPVKSLAEAIVRSVSTVSRLKPTKLNPMEALSPAQYGTLVQVSADLISQSLQGNERVLRLQDQQRVFQATLQAGHGALPPIVPGSRLQITGVCDDEMDVVPSSDTSTVEKSVTGSLNIRMRHPGDAVVLRGPPWWTWKRTVTLVGALLAILSTTLLWIHILRRRLERQQAAQLAFSQQILKRLEDERRRIAGNLHDSLGQVLLAIKNQTLLAMQRSTNESGLHQRLDEISGATSKAIEEVREITHGLRPYQLDRLGLTQAIRTAVNQVSSNSSIVFASRVEDIDSIFDKDAEINVYRIVQEAVNNVVKHSEATEAAVVVKKRNNCISVSIRDNGKGFDLGMKSTQPHGLGYGLNGIAERVRILGGHLDIDSRPGGGTNLNIEVPASTHT